MGQSIHRHPCCLVGDAAGPSIAFMDAVAWAVVAWAVFDRMRKTEGLG